jgi:hypothetical protein
MGEARLEMAISAQSYVSQAAGRMRPCKVLCAYRTKVFHVKRFCPIEGRNRTKAVSLEAVMVERIEAFQALRINDKTKRRMIAPIAAWMTAPTSPAPSWMPSTGNK